MHGVSIFFTDGLNRVWVDSLVQAILFSGFWLSRAGGSLGSRLLSPLVGATIGMVIFLLYARSKRLGRHDLAARIISVVNAVCGLLLIVLLFGVFPELAGAIAGLYAAVALAAYVTERQHRTKLWIDEPKQL
jgi:hypothetical protein